MCTTSLTRSCTPCRMLTISSLLDCRIPPTGCSPNFRSYCSPSTSASCYPVEGDIAVLGRVLRRKGDGIHIQAPRSYMSEIIELLGLVGQHYRYIPNYATRKWHVQRQRNRPQDFLTSGREAALAGANSTESELLRQSTHPNPIVTDGRRLRQAEARHPLSAGDGGRPHVRRSERYRRQRRYVRRDDFR